MTPTIINATPIARPIVSRWTDRAERAGVIDDDRGDDLPGDDETDRVADAEPRREKRDGYHIARKLTVRPFAPVAGRVVRPSGAGIRRPRYPGCARHGVKREV